MRVSWLLVVALLLAGCTDDPCEPKTGKTSCGYCAQDRLTTSNPHAGMCRYCGGDVVCSGDICGDDLACNSRVFLSVPGATFHAGSAPTGSSSSGTPAVTVSPASATWSMGATVRWTLQWSVAVTITAVQFEVTSLGGYFEVPVTVDESNAGALELSMTETATAPTSESCLGTTCWGEATGSSTTGEGHVALVGSGGPGERSAAVPLSWARPSSSQSTGTGGGGGTTGCPTSGAQLGCCTTRGGIQILGFGLAAGCSCPADTCSPHAGSCGCPACGGC
ncbi:MAG: hypothetical protein ACOZQL_02930 [Myxococcota bacterium]